MEMILQVSASLRNQEQSSVGGVATFDRNKGQQSGIELGYGSCTMCDSCQGFTGSWDTCSTCSHPFDRHRD